MPAKAGPSLSFGVTREPLMQRVLQLALFCRAGAAISADPGVQQHIAKVVGIVGRAVHHRVWHAAAETVWPGAKRRAFFGEPAQGTP